MPNDKITLWFSKLDQAMADIPTIVGNEAVNFFLDEFDKAEWDGVPWELRKDKKNTSHLLVKSGTLRRGIRVISTSATTVIVGNSVPYAQVHNDGGEINRAARSETFVRPRYERGKKGAMFGGMGAFRKMTPSEKISAPAKGQTYKAYSYRMPMRRSIGNSAPLRERLRQAVIAELKLKLKGT